MTDETRAKQRRGDRLGTVADTIRRMNDAPVGSERNMRWDERQLEDLDTERQVDGFNMAIWLAGPLTVEEGPHQRGCKTIGCIAGTTATIFRKDADETDWGGNGAGLVNIAASILGLDEQTASTLFWGPPPNRASMESITREQAARACDNTAAGCKPEDIWAHV